MLDTGLNLTLICGMRGTTFKTRVLESAAGTEFAKVNFPAHTLWKGEKWPVWGLFIPRIILKIREWPGSRVSTLPCPREIYLGLFDANSGIAGRNNANSLTY